MMPMRPRYKNFLMIYFLVCISSLCLGQPSQSQNKDQQVIKEAPFLASNPALEVKVKEIAEELRCLVCQNETIAGSHAELAIDLRNQIRTQLQSGGTKESILQYMVERYGDFVLYNPPFKAKTSLLWLGPLALLLLSLFVLRNYLRQQKNTNKTAAYDSADLAQARELLRQSKPVNHLSNPSMTKDN